MVSVVMAAYNGEKYIREQLLSVLKQLSENDEVIISDDNPYTGTYEAVKGFIESDGRIRYIKGPGKGVIKNFENAISAAEGDYIFLCDQDDVWLDGKVSAVCEELKKGAVVVMHDAIVTDENLNPVKQSFFEAMGSGTGIIKNIIKNTYIGCCMAFSKSLKPFILPFPDDLPMHDQWIGLAGEKAGRVALIKEPLIYYRRHSGAVTGGRTSFSQKLKWRMSIIKAVIRKQVH